MHRNELLSDKFEGQSLLNCLEALEDPRIDRKKLYPLQEILLVSLCAMISGCEGFKAFAVYGEEKLEFFKQVYPFTNGIPSHDTIARIFSLICPKEFSILLTRWVEGLRENLSEINHIAFDGKTLRGSRISGKPHSAVHVVSAFCSQTRLSLAQFKAPHKGYGENDSMLEIIKYLKVNGSIISADAAYCRLPIAQAIIDKKADYVLSVKKNQGNMFEAIKSHFDCNNLRNKANYNEHIDKGHGRIEVRRCWVTDDVRCLQGLPEWPNLKSIICIESERNVNNKVTSEKRYYISSTAPDPVKMAKIIRSHWSIENSLHWVLDVTFSEDKCRARVKNAPENMSILRKLVVNLLQKIRKPNESLKSLRIRAAANENKLLNFVNNI